MANERPRERCRLGMNRTPGRAFRIPSHQGPPKGYAAAMGALVVVLALAASAGAQTRNAETAKQGVAPCMPVHVVGNYAYIGEGNGLRILDVSNPASPAPLGIVLLPDVLQGIHVSGNLAYVADYEGDLQIVDISDVSQPTVLGAWQLVRSPVTGVFVAGDLVYVVFEEFRFAFQIVNVSDPTSPWRVGALERFIGGTRDSRDVQVSGDVAYVGDYPSNLLLIDVADPASPGILSSFSSSFDPPGVINGFHVSGAMVYIADGTGGFRIADCSNPAAPSLVGSIDVGYAQAVFVSNGRAYVLAGQLVIVDVGNPASPSILSSGGPSTGFGSNIWVAGSHAYVTNETGLSIIDVSNPSSPTVVGAYVPPDPPTAPSDLRATTPSLNEIDLVWQDNSDNEVGFSIERRTGIDGAWAEIATVAADVVVYHDVGLSIHTTYYYRVRAYNSMGTSPYSNEVSATPGGPLLPPAAPSNLTVSAVAFNQVDLAWLDNSDNEYSFRIERKTGANGTWSEIATVGADVTSYPDTGVSMITTYYYRVLAYNQAGVSAYSNEVVVVTPAWNVELVGHVATPGTAHEVFVSGGVACIAGDNEGLQIVDVSNPASPTVAATFQTGSAAFGVHVVGDVAYVATCYGGGWQYGLEIVDLSDPTSPTLLSFYNTSSMNVGARHVHVADGLAYLPMRGPPPGFDYPTLMILDVSDPTSPTLRGAWMTSDVHLDDVWVCGNTAYAVFGQGTSLWTFDVTDPSQPTVYSFPGVYGVAIHVADGVAYCADTGRGGRLLMVDVGDPTSPSLLGVCLTRGEPHDVFVVGNLAYVADWEQGLTVMDLHHGPISVAAFDTDDYSASVHVVGDLVYLADHHQLWILRVLKPNLTVTAGDFGPASPQQVQPGDSVTLGAYLINDSNTACGTFWFECWGSRTGGLMIDVPLTESDLLGPLMAGEDVPFAATKLLRSVPDGPYTVVYYADRIGEVAESNECDNRQVVAGKRLLVLRPQTQADLVVEGFSLAPDPAWSGQSIQMTGQVRNAGSAATGEFWIEFWGTVPVGDNVHYPDIHFMLCDSIKVDNLAPGAAVDLSTYTRTLHDGLPMGTFWVGCFADRPDYVNELDETNNYAFLAGHTLYPPPPSAAGVAPFRIPHSAIRNQFMPDLVIAQFDFAPAAPTQLRPGDNVQIDVRVENRGTTDAGAFWLEFWASNLGGLRPWPQLTEASERVPGLAAGTSLTLALAKPLAGISDGPWSVVAVADRLHEVTESNEANNRLAVAGKRALVVRAQTDANLVLEHFEISTGTLVPGQLVRVSATVRNDGATNSGVFWIEFWASRDQCYPTLDFMLRESIRVGNLGPGETRVFQDDSHNVYDWLPPGQYAIGCFVDRVDQVNETNESDNYRFVGNRTIPPPIAIRGTVRESLCWILEDDLGLTFELVGGDAGLRQDDLRVEVTGYPVHLMSTCMMGQAFRVLSWRPLVE